MNRALKGNLKDVSLTRILIELNRNRATGTLAVTTPRFTKNIYVRDGSVIFASSTFEDDRLGEMLVKAGKISLEQYDKSVELLKTSKKRQGAILVDLGYITPKDLFWGVKYQVKEIIYSIFQLEDGAYEFNENAIPPDEVITLKISMNNLIYEGGSRIDNITRIRREMPEVKSIFTLNEDPAGIFKGIDLSSLDRTILSLVDGKRSINQLIEESRVNSFDVMKTLYVLWSTGFIVEREIPGKAQEETVDIGEEILESVTEEDHVLKKKVEEDTQAALLEEQFKRGVEEFKRGNYWGAAELFRLVTRNFSKNPKAWSYLSLSLSKIPNRLKEAEEALLQAIKLEPFSGEHYANLGHLYLKAGLSKRAHHQFEKALKLDPENAKAKKGLDQIQQSP
ncbi:MAG: DUF4388 domain-containing protein [Nitrospirae bacterium]|nr:DUF4388 domain-containing protein [Nitrospirota bacterium]MCL5423047.1 DUF4388 domain-containing protein [Nitrospirota bacterium]